MANHALPTTSSLYTDVLTNLKDRIDDSLKMLDSVNTSPTNVPTNSIRWNSTTTLWEKYNGSSWISLAASYAIKVLKSTNLVGGNGTTFLGSIPYQSGTDTTTLLGPNTTTTRKFLRQTGTGTNGAAPVWDTILASDIPTLNQNTTGSAAKLTTARNINGISFDGTANIEIEDRLGTAIASAATTTIGTVGLGNYIHITGTTTITSFGTAGRVGIRRTLIFDGALTITHNATSLICLGAANIVTVAGTIIEVVAETTANWRVLSISHPEVSMTEIGYLNGVTSDIQTQINNTVKLTGNETIAGIKTFSSSPIVPNATTATQAIAYGQAVKNTGDETISGVKTFSSSPIVPTPVAGDNSTKVATTAFVKAKSELDSIGVGQTWQDMTASRSSGVTYTNATGKPIKIRVNEGLSGTDAVVSLYINGKLNCMMSIRAAYDQDATISEIIPSGATYMFTSAAPRSVLELR